MTQCSVTKIVPYAETHGIKKINADTYQSGDTTFQDIQRLGMDSYAFAKFVVHYYGFQFRSIQDIFQYFMPNQTMMGYKNSQLVVSYGVERLGVGKIRSTITVPGTGYDTVEIEIFSPGGGNRPWYGVGKVLVGSGDRHYFVTDTGTSVDGFQTLVLKPMDFRPNVRVLPNGQSEDFPDNKEIGEMGTLKPIGSCFPEYLSRNYGHTEKTFGLTRYMDRLNTNREQLTNEVKGIDFYDLDIVVGGKSSKIAGFIDKKRLQQTYENIAYFNASMFYGQAMKDPEGRYFASDGLVKQIPPEFQRFWQPGQMTYKRISNMIRDWTINNLYVGQDLIWLCGSVAYSEVMDALRHSSRIQYMEPPPYSMTEAAKKHYLGQVFDGVFHDFGYRIKIVRCPELDMKWFAPRESPIARNAGIYSNDMFICDPSPISNLDITNARYEKEPENKIQMWTRQKPNGSLEYTVDVFKASGIVDENGNTRNGAVNDFNEDIQYYHEIQAGIALIDPTSILHITSN